MSTDKILWASRKYKNFCELFAEAYKLREKIKGKRLLTGNFAKKTDMAVDFTEHDYIFLIKNSSCI